jgi:hypothetical protein
MAKLRRRRDIHNQSRGAAGTRSAARTAPRMPTGKSFLVLFFKKEHIFFLRRAISETA